MIRLYCILGLYFTILPTAVITALFFFWFSLPYIHQMFLIIDPKLRDCLTLFALSPAFPSSHQKFLRTNMEQVDLEMQLIINSNNKKVVQLSPQKAADHQWRAGEIDRLVLD